jgi:hypothetical protein
MFLCTEAFAVVNKKRIPSRLSKKSLEEVAFSRFEFRQRISKRRNDNDVVYALTNRQVMMGEKVNDACCQQRQAVDLSESLIHDSAIRGKCLKYKIIDGGRVELEWASASEAGALGFVVKRRPAKTEIFDVIADFKSFSGLANKGSGVYRYMDENVTPGEWFYCVTECASNGGENDLSECLIKIQKPLQQLATKIALAGFVMMLRLSSDRSFH